jgi:hypothetical protein
MARLMDTRRNMIAALTERLDMPQLELLPRMSTLLEALDALDLAVQALKFGATVCHRVFEDKAERLYIVAQDEVRQRAISESFHVFESQLSLLRSRRFQCTACMQHGSCVIDDRHGMQCLAYFLSVAYAEDLEWYAAIPLTILALASVDFHTLLLLGVIHHLNFQTLHDLSSEGLRQRLAGIDHVSAYGLTV